MTTLIIEGLHRDVLKNRSFVTVTWKGEPEKRDRLFRFSLQRVKLAVEG